MEPAHILTRDFCWAVSPVSRTNLSQRHLFYNEELCRQNITVKPAKLLYEFVILTQECFESLLKMLQWSWNTFCAVVGEMQGLKGISLTAVMLDLERLVYISTAGLRLLKMYIREVYPSDGMWSSPLY